jgi:hypothetical protein
MQQVTNQPDQSYRFVGTFGVYVGPTAASVNRIAFLSSPTSSLLFIQPRPDRRLALGRMRMSNDPCASALPPSLERDEGDDECAVDASQAGGGNRLLTKNAKRRAKQKASKIQQRAAAPTRAEPEERKPAVTVRACGAECSENSNLVLHDGRRRPREKCAFIFFNSSFAISIRARARSTSTWPMSRLNT